MYVSYECTHSSCVCVHDFLCMYCVCMYVCMIELRLRGKTFENTLYKVHLKDENQNVISTYSAVPRQAQFNPGQVILGGGMGVSTIILLV